MSANDLPGYFAAKGKPQVEDRKKEELRKSVAIPLQNEWTFWLDKYVQGLSPAEYEQNLKIISTVGTPIWEDPKNENGGAYNFRINKKDAPVGWREALMLLVGEQFEDCLSADDSVCGVSVSTRYNDTNFQIWTTNAAAKNEEKVMTRLTQVLAQAPAPIEIQTIYYKAANDTSASTKEQSLRERPRFFNKRPEEVPGDLIEQTAEQRAHNEILEKELADGIAAVQLKDRQERENRGEEAQA
ncbi:translation initiation factor eIF 4e-like domain-containing protein [Jimgerdemannia flammicorona]|uniref:Translation initiation factor eIF 4e-like domain-containing protein n=1 Tax=Jimgerdemannia flammicorona TaxID=994334 RepID=A0A433Q920_9FUNG|nr:translation initiation factor eIF 4e-like domain-containing protein [Jimgerdemannia flammicorona]